MANRSRETIGGREDLERIKRDVEALTAVRRQIDGDGSGKGASGRAACVKDGAVHVMLCFGTGCISSGAVEVKESFVEEIKRRKLEDKVALVETGCNGFCAGGPIVVVYPGEYFYHAVTAADAVEIVREHLMNGRLVERRMYHDAATGRAIPRYRDIPFFANQNPRVLRNKGIICAESLDEYIGRDGYFGLERTLMSMRPEEIIEEVKKSGLRGRGGAGFLTGIKWDLCRKAKGEEKYILCNADEGDPGAFMDRSLIESDPHAVLEGMMIGARAVGATVGYIYCRAEYPLALERLNHAIAECRRRGLLGERILGSEFSFDIRIAQGSGAFVCGEETALMRSIEGMRGEPRPRPPFPANKGLFDKPSVLNNVETFGNVPSIIRNGSDWYRGVGTAKSPGTKIFALSGKVNNIGLVEVNMGTPLGNVIYDIGGGIPGGKKFKAAQIGGPSGGCITKENLNVPVDYESLNELGAIMGSGGLIVMDEDACMVDVARYFLDFVQDESCGKCVPCRVGTKRMLEMLERICEGKGEMADIDRLVELGQQIKDTALCGLGQTAPNPVLSTIRYFRDEYVAHIRDRKCPAGVCSALVRAPCQNGCPAGVDVPGFVSLVGERRYSEALSLHRERNPFAAICASVCFHPCETKCRRATLDAPLAIRGVKKFMVTKETKPQLPEIRKNAANEKRKVAIVGAGPAGLSCAYFLARLGYKPVVFEAEKQAGGMLVQTIPAYRMERRTLEREIRMVRDLGVKIETGRKLGRDFTLKSLKDKGYEAVFLGVGAPEGSKMGLAGESTGGVVDGVKYLRDFNLHGKVPTGDRVAVIGGGNVAIDVARTALRLGAKEVTVLYRRTREEMPAWKEEIEEALREGVKFQYLVAPKEIVASNGRAEGVKCNRMELGQYDKSGRKRPVEKPGDEFVVAADQVVAAIGQSLDSAAIMNGTSLKTNRSNWIEADPVTGQTSVEWVFAGGDAVTGPSSVIEAVAAGERAAVGIDRCLTGAEHAFWRKDKTVDTAFDSEADPSKDKRAEMTHLPVAKRKGSFKSVEVTWNESTARREARRCLRCDYRETCVETN